MTRRSKIVLTIAAVMLGVGAWFAYHLMYTLQHIDEAYAAWDTGTLLVEYMKLHDRKWPKSWNNLLTVLESESGQKIPLRGAQAGDMKYARSLAEMVTIDWTFDPAHPVHRNPVSPRSGGEFTVVWGHHEPNDMIREFLANPSGMPPSAAD